MRSVFGVSQLDARVFLVGLWLACQLGSVGDALAGDLQSHGARAVEQRLRSLAMEFAERVGPPQVHGRGGVGFDRCAWLFPGGRVSDVPKFDARWQVVELCANHFATAHSSLTKTPVLVVERLNRLVVERGLSSVRTNEFYVDARLPQSGRAELVDYVGSGYDRGHLASAANQPDQVSMAQSFALSNMVPQDPVSNREGAWLKAEKDTRKFVRRASGDVYVFNGPLFKGEVRRIGRGHVWVPSHLFKLVYDEGSGRAWAYIVENAPQTVLTPPMSYDEFVRETGMDLLGRHQMRSR